MSVPTTDCECQPRWLPKIDLCIWISNHNVMEMFVDLRWAGGRGGRGAGGAHKQRGDDGVADDQLPDADADGGGQKRKEEAVEPDVAGPRCLPGAPCPWRSP